MQKKYETKRLVLCVAEEDRAKDILDFCKRNHDYFSRFEPEYPENYYTQEYQALFIQASMKQFLNKSAARYYLYEKGAEETVLGCVAFSDIKLGEEKTCKISYKLDMEAQGMGFAEEAVEFLIAEVAKEFGIHRIEADIMPDNERSLRLAEKVGFKYEGIAVSSHMIAGKWEDHARYAIIIT